MEYNETICCKFHAKLRDTIPRNRVNVWDLGGNPSPVQQQQRSRSFLELRIWDSSLGGEKKRNPAMKGWLRGRGGGRAFPGQSLSHASLGARTWPCTAKGQIHPLGTPGDSSCSRTAAPTLGISAFPSSCSPHRHKYWEKATKNPREQGKGWWGPQKGRVQREPFPCSWAASTSQQGSLGLSLAVPKAGSGHKFFLAEGKIPSMEKKHEAF